MVNESVLGKSAVLSYLKNFCFCLALQAKNYYSLLSTLQGSINFLNLDKDVTKQKKRIHRY